MIRTLALLSAARVLFAQVPATPPPAAPVLSAEPSPEQRAERSALKAGQTAPDFTLPGVDGKPAKLSVFLKKGPVVLTFYRGGWCPYCNAQLKSYQDALPAIQGAGATLVAVSPQLPDRSVMVAARHELAFPVLSDVGNKVAKSFGLTFVLEGEMASRYAFLADYNGAGPLELPLPATYVIGRDGKILFAFVQADYKQRLAAADLVKALEATKAR